MLSGFLETRLPDIVMLLRMGLIRARLRIVLLLEKLIWRHHSLTDTSILLTMGLWSVRAGSDNCTGARGLLLAMIPLLFGFARLHVNLFELQ